MSHKPLSKTPSEVDLVESIRLGGKAEQVALSYINQNEKFHNSLRKFLFENHGKEQDVMPVFNDGLMALHRKVLKLKDSEVEQFALWGYFYRSCQFIWFKELRKAKKNISLINGLLSGFKRWFKSVDNHQNSFDESKRIMIEELIDELGEPDRSVLLLKELGLSYMEIREKLNISSVVNARRIHFNSKNRLLKKVSELYPDGI
jgi:DNA-directed RNA polymerase specialized sigma24 family protein